MPDFEPVGVTNGGLNQTMFQCLGSFGGNLYAGCYSRIGADIAIYKYPPVFEEDDYMGLYDLGESVYVFAEFKGRYYAATESTSKILRLNIAKDDWDVVHNTGDYNLVLALCVFGDYLYAYVIDFSEGIYDGKIIRTSNGTDWTDAWIAGDKFLPDFVVYDSKIYAFGRHENGKVWAKRSPTGAPASWSDVGNLCNLYGDQWQEVILFESNLYITRRTGTTTKIYSYNGSSLTEVFSLSNAPPRSEFITFDSRIWLLLSPNGWSDPDPSKLYASSSGAIDTWELVKTWTGKSGRCMGVYDSKLYLGIQKTLYRMDEETVPNSPTNCAAFFEAPDESYCSWQDNSDDETGFRIEYRLNAPTWTWLPTKEMGGVLSLATPITISEYDYCGFDFLIPFVVDGVIDLLDKGVRAIINTSGSTGEWGGYTVEEWAEMPGVEAFFLGNDCPYNVATIQSWYNAIKARTTKPVGAIFWKPANDTDRNKLIEISDILDFIMPYYYPYRDGKSQEDIDADIAYMIALAGDLNCPVILGAQAMDDDYEGMADPGEVGVRNQHDQYYAAGIPIWWYSWTNTITDIKRNYQDLMNELYHGWTFFENKGVNATQSSLKQFTIGDHVKWRVRAYNAVGDSAWAVSDNVYIGGGGILGIWTTQADFEAGVLTDVWVPEGLNRLELERTSLTGTAVYIFDGGPGKRYNWLSFTSTKPNQNIYFRDDFRDNSLEAWTIVGGTWVGYGYYLKGTGNLSWGINRVRVGSLSWQGIDALFKGFNTGGGETDPDHRFFFRADSQGDNVNAYGFVLASGGNVYAVRVADGAVLDNIDKGVASPSKDVWYWFRAQIYTSGDNVIQRIRWWLVGNEEPEEWNVTHTWTGEWRSQGCFSLGRHTSAGENRYDNFLLSRKEGIPSPANCLVSFKFYPSSNGTDFGSEQTDITKVPNSRFIKIQATLTRTSLLSAMPTIEDMTLGYRLATQAIFI